MLEERPRVLIAAQSTETLASLERFLELRSCFVAHCTQAENLARDVSTIAPHLIIVWEPLLLDLLDVCRKVRSATHAPILVLGHRDAEEDEVLCLEYGADTYLPPGVSHRRLQAHTNALLRRGLALVPVEAPRVISFGDVRIDVQRQRVYRGDREVDLSHKEYAVLRFLLDNAGRAVTRQALSAGVWGSSIANDNRALDVHIHWLREKLEVDAANPQLIRTVRGVGYCLET